MLKISTIPNVEDRKQLPFCEVIVKQTSSSSSSTAIWAILCDPV